MMSVSTALPLWKNTPATAGTSASPSGADCQCDSSSSSLSGTPVSAPWATRGRNRASVDERIEWRASDTEPDSVELRRGESASDGAAAGRWRRLMMDHRWNMGGRRGGGEEQENTGYGVVGRARRGLSECDCEWLHAGSASATTSHRPCIHSRSMPRISRCVNRAGMPPGPAMAY